MAGHGMHPVDVRMLEQLGAIVAVVDPVPAQLVEMGRQLFGFRDPDAAVMEAVGLEGVGASAVRSGRPSRMHFFELEDVSLDVELTVGDTFCAVLGAVTAAAGDGVPQGWSVALETTSATYASEVGADGRFAFPRVPPGMIRFHLDRGDRGDSGDGGGRVRVTSPWLDAR